MADDIDWNEEIAEFDANMALTETRIMWLRLGRTMAGIVEHVDWMDDLKAAAEVMGWAARAEACLWRATGDAATIDADIFIPELRARSVTLGTGGEG